MHGGWGRKGPRNCFMRIGRALCWRAHAGGGGPPANLLLLGEPFVEGPMQGEGRGPLQNVVGVGGHLKTGFCFEEAVPRITTLQFWLRASMVKRQGRHQRSAAKAAGDDPLGDDAPLEDGPTKRLRAEALVHLAKSPLALGLVLRWAEAGLAAVDVQDLAQLAGQSGCPCPEVQWLATIGSRGADPSHCSRALHGRYCKQLDTLPEPIPVAVPLRVSRNAASDPIEGELLVFYAQDWCSKLSAHFLDEFIAMFGLNEVAGYWNEHSTDDPRMHKHPMLKQSGWEAQYCPLLLHGDAASFQDRDSLLTVSLKPMLGHRGTAEDSHLLLCACPKSSTAAGTWDTLWRIVAWSLTCMFEGVHPACDAFGGRWPAGSSRALLAGTPICKIGNTVWKFVLWGITGDLDFFSAELGLPYHSCEEFCWRCNCNRSDKVWTDFRSSAAWVETILPAPALVTDLPNPVFSIPGVTLATIMFDVMHVCDLGVCLYSMGSALWSIIFEDMLAEPGTPEEKFAEVWRWLKERAPKCALTKLHLGLVCDVKSPKKEYPYLRGVKAAESRHLVPAVALLCEAFASRSTKAAHRAKAFTALNNFYEELHSGGLHLADRGKRMSEHVSQFLLHHQWLARQAADAGVLLWSIVPKFHFFVHLAMSALYDNPRNYWVYSGESFVGAISRLAHMCTFGRPVHTVTAKLLPRYRVGLYIRLGIVNRD